MKIHEIISIPHQYSWTESGFITKLKSFPLNKIHVSTDKIQNYNIFITTNDSEQIYILTTSDIKTQIDIDNAIQHNKTDVFVAVISFNEYSNIVKSQKTLIYVNSIKVFDKFQKNNIAADIYKLLHEKYSIFSGVEQTDVAKRFWTTKLNKIFTLQVYDSLTKTIADNISISAVYNDTSRYLWFIQ